MLKRMAAAMAAVVFIVCAVAMATGGTEADPVARKSDADKAFRQLNSRVSELGKDVPTKVNIQPALARLDGLDAVGSADALARQVEYEGYMRLVDGDYYLAAAGGVSVTLKAGERVVVTCGSEFMLLSGGATIEGARSAAVVNVSAGGESAIGQAAAVSNRYVSGGGGLVGLHTSGGATVSVSGYYQVIPAMQSRHTDAAFALQGLGLMRGSGKGFELERRATRLEALIMFLRLIGEEQAALMYGGSHPFYDVPVWGGDAANKYVAYAYSKGYTKGVDKTRFGSADSVTAEQYVTFVLRALGYVDGTDFVWSSATASAVRMGIITDIEQRSIERGGFYRDDMAYISYRSLAARTAGGTVTLLERLMDMGVVEPFAGERLQNISRIGG